MGLAWWHRDVGAGSSQRVFVERLGCRDPVETSLAKISALVDSDDAIPAVNSEFIIAGLADLAKELATWANKVTAKDSGWGVFFAEVGASGVSCGGHAVRLVDGANLPRRMISARLFSCGVKIIMQALI
jgi:hypothetical protein